jgi:anaerobic selenocysteine-containing dehydrogenase
MQVRCRSPHGEITVVAMLDDAMRPGVVSLPHGYGIQYQGGPALGPALNMLTWAAHCDRIAGTPFHKHVPVALEALV